MSTVQPAPNMAIANSWQHYRLLDAGDGMKMEQWGKYTLVRPDPQVIWPRRAGPKWESWDGFYHRSDKGGGSWEYRSKLPDSWNLDYASLGLRFRISPTSFKHTGLFPEQAINWEWCSERIKAARTAGREVSVLNLFGYTGGATCAAAKAGAQVVHVDAAEGMVKWCRENAQLSGLNDAPIRFITDDCLKFVRREIRRGRHYDAIIMDPPTYGRGSGGEMWKLEDHLWELLAECGQLLSDNPVFFLINAYTARLSPTVVTNLLAELMHQRGGKITGGEVGLTIEADGKILPCGVYGRWQAGKA
jgi:23S rRNA (cytosine1962-C5)-methyltransferase